VHVEEPRRQHGISAVERPRCLRASQPANGYDPIATDSEIGATPRAAAPVDDSSIREEQVEHGVSSGSRLQSGHVLSAAKNLDTS